MSSVIKSDLSCFACKAEDAFRDPLLTDEEEGLSIRSPYSRDRDRILYTKSFRILSEKTQVYLNSEDSPSNNEYSRTRLTHTLEVASIAKTISRLLGLNCDLVEAIAYGHDIGHPPFGHAGEEQLDLFLNGKMPLPRYILDCLNSNIFAQKEDRDGRQLGDFKHNFQSVRQLAFLFSYDHQTEGLNLTFQCLEGILKHTGLESKLNPKSICKYPQGPHQLFRKLIYNEGFQSTLEAKVVALSDEIAQVCHDISDAIGIGVIPLNKFLEREDVKAAKSFAESHGKKVNIQTNGIHNDTNNILISSAIVEYFTRSTYEQIKELLGKQRKDAKIQDFINELPAIPAPEDNFNKLQEYKDNVVINNYSMNRMDNKGKYVIRKLIEAYLCDPRQLPDTVLRRYYKIKSKEYSLRGQDYIKDWFGQIEGGFGIKNNRKLSPDDINTILTLIQTDSEGTAFRKMDSQLVRRLKPYLALDADYLRTIADHIAMLTDMSAEKEMTALYGH